MKTYLGLDLGSKTCGVSISTSGIIASPLTTIRFKDDDYQDCLNQLLALINQYQVQVVILGLPKHMNNDLGIRGEISQNFKQQLDEKNLCETHLWDERLSTKTALKTLSDSKKKKGNQKNLKDQVAAQIILQNYLDYLNR
jgi:putative Holliday junction resolvase